MYNFANNCQFDGSVLNKIYEDAFGIDKTDGWFVEVGASNGQDYSNTCGLADAGWSGVYIEPVAELARACTKRHAKNEGVRVLHAGAGRLDSLGKFWLIPSWGTATSNQDAAMTIDKQSVKFESTVFKLDSILIAGLCPIGFELLVIDVDFGEIDVLKGFTINLWRPKLVIIELHEDSNHPLSEDVRQFALPYFADAGYEKIYHDGINSIFKAPV